MEELLIDTNIIDLLKSELSEDIFDQLIDIYLTDLENNVRLLDEYVLRYNMTQAKEVAHAIKGSSSNIGAVLLQKHAHSLENACKEENAEKMLSSIDSLKKAARATAEHLRLNKKIII